MHGLAICLILVCGSVLELRVRGHQEAELHTSNRYHYDSLEDIGVKIRPRQTSFTFEVRASNDAHLALHRYSGDTSRDMYELVIGGWGNSQSAIRNKMQGTNLVSVKHNPLSSQAFHHFWVSWRNGRIAVGTGKRVGKGQFMTYTDGKPHSVNYISVSTGWGATGDWRFGKGIRSPIILATGDNYRYHPVDALSSQIKHKRSFSFYVKACNDAHIALQSHRGDEVNGMYEIVIGGWKNTKSVIRKSKQGTNLVHANHCPLSANNYLPFWISFRGGLVAVGEGTVVGSRQFMSIKGRTRNIKYFSVATGWGATASWLFYQK